MNWYKLAKQEQDEMITDEMRNWFDKRTNKHIELVQKYAKKIAQYDPERFGDLVNILTDHDQSKFEEPEYTPYIWITWKYKLEADGKDGKDGKKFEPSEKLQKEMTEATDHHVKNNEHHPEYWDPGKNKKTLINSENRDKAADKIDARKMPLLAITEMVADWCSVSDERGNSPKSWADKNVNTRWQFNDEAVELIYELIDAIWQ